MRAQFGRRITRLPSVRTAGIFAMLLLAATQASCDKGIPTTATFHPVALGVSDVCQVPADSNPNGGLGGDARLQMKPDEVVAGFERFYQSDPLRNIQHFYRGGVRFNLDTIRQLPSKVIDKAILHFNIRQSYVSSADGTKALFPNRISCAAELSTAGADWSKLITSEGYAVTPLPTDTLIARLPNVSDESMGGMSVDVTDAARNWLVYPNENFGVVLQGADENVTRGRNNSACATRYGDFTLEVHYTVFGAMFPAGN